MNGWHRHRRRRARALGAAMAAAATAALLVLSGTTSAQPQVSFQGKVTSNTFDAKAGSGPKPSNSGAPYNPLADDCTYPGGVSQPSAAQVAGCQNVGLTHGYFGNHMVNFLYTANFYCDPAVPSKAVTGCEAGRNFTKLPPGAESQDPVYTPVPLGFTPKQGLQCPKVGNCIDHPNTIDLSALFGVLKPILHLHSASQLNNAPLSAHSHVIFDRNDNLPEWWNVVLVPVTSQAGFNAVISTTSDEQLDHVLGSPGVSKVEVPTNLFLYFQVLAGTGHATAVDTRNQNVYHRPAGPRHVSPGTARDPLNISDHRQTRNCGAVPGGPVPPPCNAKGIGLTRTFYEGHLANVLYSQNYFCDRTVPAKTANGCEAGYTNSRTGKGWNTLPPGTPSTKFIDPLYIITPLFTPEPGNLQCPTRGYCVDHPTRVDLSRLFPTLKPILGVKRPSQLAHAPLAPHSHIVLTDNHNQPEWWPVNILGVTSRAAYDTIIHSSDEFATAQRLAAHKRGVTEPIPTNIFLWFQVLPGQVMPAGPTPSPSASRVS